MVFRANSSNLTWKYVDSEKLNYYLEELRALTQAGYIFKSFTIDGRRGVVQVLQRYFNTVPIQICVFHQVQIVTRYTTRSPKTDCGKELRKLILTLKTATKTQFTKDFNELQGKYKDFLKERNELNQFQHRRLRSSIRSIKSNLDYLFTFQDYPELKIPNTTNSADGSFGQWKYKVRLHRHLRIDRMKQMIDELLK
jgi:transposase-like protein